MCPNNRNGTSCLNLPTRPEWFFDYEKYGGILCDIASHQIDQFLFFTAHQRQRLYHQAPEILGTPFSKI